MPIVRVDDIDMYYEELGSGHPLMMIMGLGLSLRDWGAQLPTILAKHFRVILFDNRGVGLSSLGSKPLSVGQMAEDTVELMDALGIPEAHLFGISMGGMVAQHFALNYRERLAKLVLGCSMAGGDFRSNLSLGKALWTRFGLKRLEHSAEAYRSICRLLFPENFINVHRETLEKFMQEVRPYHSCPEIFSQQLKATAHHNACNVLKNIQSPTLVLAGTCDQVIPAERSKVLARGIAGAEYQEIADAGHGFYFSHAEVTATVALKFLDDRSI
ncbi:MAG: alpha/beta hydrolase [Anaerolineae bacterium]|nr:alpha/beta hydrolase [Gloeobacterales cyanobacterium ES-bin-313]